MNYLKNNNKIIITNHALNNKADLFLFYFIIVNLFIIM